ncbi:MAG: VapC toxin family PIN domain ribonuclease, partial [Chloroflexi bacterium]|nr:VapC toxin family PIN domain ribonuclease [Chloroflexota bacterium]
MIIDANLLIYAVDTEATAHAQARHWLEEQLNGSARVGLPWQSLTAFLRIVTHPRALDQPMRPSEAWGHVDRWLRA